MLASTYQKRDSKLVNAFVSRLAEVRRVVRRYPSETICGGILFLMSVNLITVAAGKSITQDELVHIPAGYEYLTRGNFYLNPEHPPLIKIWSTWPLILARPTPSLAPMPAGQDFAQRTMTFAGGFWQANHGRLRLILLARLPAIALTLMLGALLFIYGRRLFGMRAALFAVALFSLDTTMLAHGKIVHTDIAAAFAYLLFLFTLDGYYRSPSFSRAIGIAAAMGFGLLTKFSLVILIPFSLIGLAYVLWKAPRLQTSRARVAAQAGAVAAVIIALFNAAYFLQHPALLRDDVNWIRSNPAATPLNPEQTILLIRALSKIVPTYYLFGLYTVAVHNHQGHPASLLGNYSDFGWWYYFPAAFALKSTLPFLLLTIASLVWAVWSAIFKREIKLIVLLVVGAIYLAVAMLGHVDIGIRHIAPVFPFLFLLGGAFLDRLLKWRTTGRGSVVLVVMLLSWMLFDAVRIYPDYLSFTNSLTFGKPSWQVLSDSNLEWGEDTADLARYLHRQGETQALVALSGGWAIPQMYDIQVDFPPADLRSAKMRYVAIGAGFLNGSTVPRVLKDERGRLLSEEQTRNYFASYRTLKPEKVFGNSIYLYRAHD
jgi:Dolichyl-phosphate-mannose-protein mannosyltransferase